MAVLAAAAQAHDRQDLRAIPGQIVLPAAQLALVLAFGLLGYTVAAAVMARIWALIAAAIVAAMVAHGLGALGGGHTLSSERKWEILRFGLPVTGAGLLIAGTNSAGLLMTTGLVGEEQTGLFAAALRVSLIGVLVVRSFTWSFAPLIPRLQENEDAENLQRLSRAATHLVLTITLPLAAVLIVFADPVAAIFGEQFDAATGAIRLMAIDLPVAALVYLLNHIITYGGHPRVALANNALLLGLILLLDYLLIPGAGATGAAQAQLTAEAIAVPLLLGECRALLKLSPIDLKLLLHMILVGILVPLAFSALRATPDIGWIIAMAGLLLTAAVHGWIALDREQRRTVLSVVFRRDHGQT